MWVLFWHLAGFRSATRVGRTAPAAPNQATQLSRFGAAQEDEPSGSGGVSRMIRLRACPIAPNDLRIRLIRIGSLSLAS